MFDRGDIIYSCRDGWGRLSVHQMAQRRYLSFGNEIEQSCIDMLRPARLCHQYTQVMMLGCLFLEARPQVLLLGLGAGSLAQALLAALPDCRVDAVEQRRQVVELAREWFELPRDRRLKVHVTDAYDYLDQDPRPADLIFADLFHDNGMDDLQAQQSFLSACRLALKPGGLLVANYWLGDPQTSLAMNQTLQAAFDHPPISLTTAEGNCIAFVFDGGPPRVRRKPLLRRAREIGAILDNPLHAQARNLLQQNRQLFNNEPGRLAKGAEHE